MIRNYLLVVFAGFLTCSLLLAADVSLAGQDAAFEKLYGNGIHAFFSHDYLKAHEYLSRAISARSKDPRSFYFRGLVCLKLGRATEARSDFAQAAALEACDDYKLYNVSKALARVQGKSRTIIEQYRTDARLAAAIRAEKLRRARYGDLREAEARALQQQARSATGQSVPLEASRSDDPFSAGPIDDAVSKRADAKATVAGASDKPSDPFATPPTGPAAPGASGKTPAANKRGGILGAMGRAMGKATRGAAANLPKLSGRATKESPPQNAAPQLDPDNPFGTRPAPPGKRPPAPQPPPAKGDNPSGKKPPSEADEPVDPDDPFA